MIEAENDYEDVNAILDPSEELEDSGLSETTVFIRGLLPEQDTLIREMEGYAAEHRVPIIQPEVAQWLTTFMQVRPFYRILEVGTAIGYSTTLLARSAGVGATVDTIEIDPEKWAIAKENIQKAGLSPQVNLHLGDAKDVLGTLQGPYDFVFLDAAKGQYLNFLSQIEPMLADNAVVLSDNVLFRGMLASKACFKRRKRTIVKRLKQYLNYLMLEGPYQSSLMPLGDGMALSIYRKKE